MFAKPKKPEVIVRTSRGTLAEQLAALRAARPGRLAGVEQKRHAAAVEAARLMDASFLAMQKLRAVDSEAHGVEYGLDLEEHALSCRLADTASPVIDEYLDALDAWWQKHRHEVPEAGPDETDAEARAAHRRRVARFHEVRREVLELRVAEVPDLHDRLGSFAREIGLAWMPPLPVA